MKRSICLSFFGLLLLLLSAVRAAAHPMPHSVLIMDMEENGVAASLELPLNELQLALGRDISDNATRLTPIQAAPLKAYVLAHMLPVGPDGRPWLTEVQDMALARGEQEETGSFQLLRMKLRMRPPAGATPRAFTLHYDVIMHQVVTHKAFASIRNDWAGGKLEEGAAENEVGIISVDPGSGRIPPMIVNLDAGSNWRGFTAMLRLGTRHIAEGTDHLLFILALLLPAPLIARGGRWAASGGMKYGFSRLLKMVTAFTAGHSLTLLAGAFGWLRLPQQPVELVIALSVLITAIHALRPLFPGRELYVAAGFGLVHGLAFATVLSGLQLSGGRMALSILGFNLGIELMQLFVVVLFAPWLMILSKSPAYRWVRTGGAIVAGLAAIGWITERLSGQSNRVGAAAELVVQQGKWIVLLLVLLALISYSMQQRETLKRSA